MYNSCNSIVQTCFMNSLYNSNSVIGSKIAHFRAKYRINFTTSTRSRSYVKYLSGACSGIRKRGGGAKSESLFFLLFNFSGGGAAEKIAEKMIFFTKKVAKYR